MKYVVDTEFIDTPACSALISLAIVCEDGRHCYFEFDYPREHITPWLAQNVVPHLSGVCTTFKDASFAILDLVGDDEPEFWCYYGAYDWYWFCRVFGGFLQMPDEWPMRYREFLDVQKGVPDICGPGHHALSDCRSVLAAMKARDLI